MAVLLEELPLQHLGAQARLAGQQVAAIGEEVENGVGFPQAGAILELQHRHLAVGVHRQELGGLRLALEDIDLAPLVRQAKQVQSQLDLVAVAGQSIAVDGVHAHLLIGPGLRG